MVLLETNDFLAEGFPRSLVLEFLWCIAGFIYLGVGVKHCIILYNPLEPNFTGPLNLS